MPRRKPLIPTSSAYASLKIGLIWSMTTRARRLTKEESMTEQPTPKTTTPTRPVSPVPSSKAALRERARREIPELRKQAEQGIATLKRLSAANR